MEPFIVGIDITSTKDLFGRNREIETLISCAKRKGNAGIIGARRFGKTCLMKSLETYLVNNSSIGAYPLYFDVKTQCGIKKNTPAVYRSMASLLASKMCLDNLLPEYLEDVLWIFLAMNSTCEYKWKNGILNIKSKCYLHLQTASQRTINICCCFLMKLIISF